MACRVRLTASAEKDEAEIVEGLLYMSGPAAARGFLDAADTAVKNLTRFPLMYPLVDEPRLRGLGYRKAFLGDYVMIYLVGDGNVDIVRVFHQRQDYARLL